MVTPSVVRLFEIFFHCFLNAFSVAVLFGLYNCIGILLGDIGCLVGGILQILAGFVVLAIEAPFCFIFIDYVQQVAEKADQRPYWNRAALYCM